MSCLQFQQLVNARNSCVCSIREWPRMTITMPRVICDLLLRVVMQVELEDCNSIHESINTHAGNVFVTSHELDI